jgi:hypothetical protein
VDGVSFVDVLMVAGQYQVKRELFVPGSEAAGVILETGPDVETVKPGERVLVNGGFSEEVVVAASRVTPLPETVAFVVAAAHDPLLIYSRMRSARCGIQRPTILIVGVGVPIEFVGHRHQRYYGNAALDILRSSGHGSRSESGCHHGRAHVAEPPRSSGGSASSTLAPGRCASQDPR